MPGTRPESEREEKASTEAFPYSLLKNRSLKPDLWNLGPARLPLPRDSTTFNSWDAGNRVRITPSKKYQKKSAVWSQAMTMSQQLPVAVSQTLGPCANRCKVRPFPGNQPVQLPRSVSRSAESD